MSEPFQVSSIDLSMRSPETGERLTANVYTLDGVLDVNGNKRLLSIGELVMAVCLERATELEKGIIDLMEEIEATSDELEILTEVEKHLLEEDAYVSDVIEIAGERNSIASWLNQCGINPVDYSDRKDLISAIENTMDDKNSFSQETMIELQSETGKRDQAYDMISNILKSLNTVLIANVNNM